ncbi:MAG: TRAP transporter, DctM subunit [Rhodobacteraceae bacterium HLUCCA24]|nr:MAG: TRAP transporter, DctM subunit [Rhodobacteraceae bacterium HLUCCA24]
MSAQLIGVAASLGLVVLIFLRVPVAIALLTVGTLGYALVDGLRPALFTLGTTPFDLAQAYSFSVVPLFLLMGVVMSRTSIAREMFDAFNALVSGRRGGLAVATVGACAGFGAVCGSSLATASTMTRVCIPEMRRLGYSDAVASGVVASGGTLGILIPPSIVLIIYAIVAQESVPALFAAALLPGLLLAALHVVVVAGLARIVPDQLPAGDRMDWGERLAAVIGMWKMLLIFALAVGGIYLGWFSPTEAASVGAALAIAIGFLTRELTLATLADAVRETVTISGALFAIILGALMFGYFMVQSRIPATLGDWITAQDLAPVMVILFFVVVYLVLGCFLDTISMVLITVPVFLPIIVELGYSAVWFGILVLLAAEVGLITPPVGLNIFVIRAQQKDIPLGTIYRGILPFLLAHLAAVGLLVAWPALALWLPSVLY